MADNFNTLDQSAATSTTSASIVDGTIVNADINASAAIDESKIASLTTDLAAKLAKASNLSDLASASTARTNLGLGNVSTRTVGAGSGQALSADTVTAKGGILAASANATLAELAVGTTGHVLKAASGQSTGLQWAAVTDTSTLPIADGSTSTAGSSLSAAAVDHRHPRYQWSPPDHGLVAWTFDVATATLGGLPSVAGRLEMGRIHLPVATNVTSIVMSVVTIGNTLTTGQCFAALYTAAGVLVGQTADQAAAWVASTGPKTMALAGGPYACAAGDYYFAFWYNGTTSPTWARGASIAGSLNFGLTAPNLRYAFADTGLTTTAPGPMGSQTANTSAWWAALA